MKLALNPHDADIAFEHESPPPHTPEPATPSESPERLTPAEEPERLTPPPQEPPD